MLKEVLERKFDPFFKKTNITLIDVGASGGLQRGWKSLEHRLRVIGFEPDERAYSEFESSMNDNFTVFNTAVLDEKGKATFYLTKKQQLSSIFIPNESVLKNYRNADRFEVIKGTDIQVDNLENILSNDPSIDADFIKLDTQGSELYILKGAERLLRSSVVGIEAEVEFLPLYERQPLFSDVDQFLRSLGFELFRIRPCYWERKTADELGYSSGQMVFGDAIYFKNKNSLEATLEKYQELGEKKSKLIKMITILLLYGHYDYASEILSYFSNYYSDSEVELLRRLIQPRHSFRKRVNMSMPKFRGRGFLASLLCKLCSCVQPMYWKCHMYLDDGHRIVKKYE